MPQFDTIIYLTFFITFFSYSCILYFLISIFIIPFFWNIYYFRFLKKEYNNFFNFLFLKLKFLFFNSNNNFILVTNNISILSLNFFNLYKLNILLLNLYITKLVKFFSNSNK